MSSDDTQRRVRSYGWVVIGVSAAVSCLAWSVRSTFALFYVALVEEFAWSRGQAALGFSLSWLLMVVFSPLAGWLHDRWGARVVVPIGALMLGLALILMGQIGLMGKIGALWEYYLIFGVLVAAGISFMAVPAAAIISLWFVRSRGTALGLLSAGASISAVVFYPVNAWTIATFGWRSAFMLFGLLVALIAVPLAALLYRNPSKDDHAARAPNAPQEASVPLPQGRGALAEALLSRQFWAVFAMWLLGVLAIKSSPRTKSRTRSTSASLRSHSAGCLAWVARALWRAISSVVGYPTVGGGNRSSSPVLSSGSQGWPACPGSTAHRTWQCSSSTRHRGSASACGSRSCPRSRPISLRGRAWGPFSGSHMRAAASAASSDRSLADGCSMSRVAINSPLLWRAWLSLDPPSLLG